jgi:hypothetical protein
MSIGRKSFLVAVVVCASSFLASITVFSETVKSEKKDTVSATAQVKSLKPQTSCPIMGGAIDKKQYVDYNGKRIYVCCGGCVAEVKKNPEAAIKKLADMGQEPETIATVNKNSTSNTKSTPKDTSMKGMDMSGSAMSKDSSMKGMDHSKMK